MTNSTDQFFEDEETTLPPPPEEPSRPTSEKASALGDFRTCKTTVATLTGGGIFDVRLTSEHGCQAEFGVDAELAALLARALDRALAEPSYGGHVVPAFPLEPVTADFSGPDPDAFFLADEDPRLSLQWETVGDRLVLSLNTTDASVYITLQRGVATALRNFFSQSLEMGR